MKVCELNGYEVHLPETGGKAGKGKAKTSTFQVRKNSIVVKQFRFTFGVDGGSRAALRKAKAFIEQASNETN